MCELLGMSFNLPVNPRISFRGFRLRGKYNRDGWGLAFYP
ncbi:class II glutamine amidotransferase, partial [Candidatus Methanodesulfokora washburnensis]